MSAISRDRIFTKLKLKLSFRCKKLMICVVLNVLILSLFFIYRSYLPSECVKPGNYHLNRGGIHCYKFKRDHLPPADFVHFGERTIFFLETSCRRRLDSRQACAIESAARANPTRTIVVLFTSPVTKYFINSGIYLALKNLSNIHIFRIHVERYVLGTPVESLFAVNGLIRQSNWILSHISDVLRFLTLYKHGGIYLDMDVIVAQSFDSLPKNWIAKQSEDSWDFASAMLSISKDRVGRTFSDHAMRELQFNYQPDVWAHNGPKLIDRVLKRMCEVKNESYICSGLQIFDSKHFNPVEYDQRLLYFEPKKMNKNLSEFSLSPFTYHLWNGLTHTLKVSPESWYAEIAREYCPSICSIYDDKFGFK